MIINYKGKNLEAFTTTVIHGFIEYKVYDRGQFFYVYEPVDETIPIQISCPRPLGRKELNKVIRLEIKRLE